MEYAHFFTQLLVQKNYILFYAIYCRICFLKALNKGFYTINLNFYPKISANFLHFSIFTQNLVQIFYIFISVKPKKIFTQKLKTLINTGVSNFYPKFSANFLQKNFYRFSPGFSKIKVR